MVTQARPTPLNSATAEPAGPTLLTLPAPGKTVSLAPFLTLWSQKHQLITGNPVAQRRAFLRPQIGCVVVIWPALTVTGIFSKLLADCS